MPPSSAAAASFLDTAFERLKLSARALTRMVKLARTVADLDASERIRSAHVAGIGNAWLLAFVRLRLVAHYPLKTASKEGGCRQLKGD